MNKLEFYLLATLYLTLFGGLHSLFLAASVKKKGERLLGSLFPWYRLIYNLLSIAFLIGYVVLFYSHDTLIWRWPNHTIWIAVAFQALGLGIIAWVLLSSFDTLEFLGIRQILLHVSSRETVPAPPLMVTGPYRLCRHPLYLGTVLFFGFWPYMTQMGLTFTLFAFVYGTLGGISEERKLEQLYGDAYARYRNTKKRIIPFLF